MNYEINFLILQSQTENVEAIRSKVKELIKKNEGTVTDELIYQKRKLAYEIKHEQYGFYTVYRFDLENGENIKGLTKDLNLEKGVTRHIVVKSNEIPELQKEIGKAPKTEEERKAEAMKKMPKKKSGEKVLAEIDTTTKKAGEKIAPAKKEPIKPTEAEPKKIEEERKVEKKAKDSTEAKVSKKTAVKEEVPNKSKKNVKKEEISMDDLDKKLDEILDI
jgi:small subunit ribosomal protein S6